MKQQVLLQDLHPHKNQPDRNGIDDLAKSIRAIGLVEPIVVAPDGDKFAIIAGHRRVEAVKSLGFDSIDAVILEDKDEAAQTAALLASNTAREDFTEMEVGQVAQTLFDLGESAVFVADVTGYTQKSVKQAAKIYKQAAETGEPEKYLAYTLAETEAILAVADQPDLMAELEKTRGNPSFNHVAERAKRDAQQRRDEAKATAELEKEGTTVVPAPSWDDKKVVSLDKLELTPKQHAKCEGHAAYVVTGYGGTHAVYCCTDAPKHHDYKTRQRSAHEDAELAKRREGMAFKKAMIAPTEVRREWIKTQFKANKQWKGVNQFLAYFVARGKHETSDLAFEWAGVKRGSEGGYYAYNITIPKDEKKAAKLLLAMVFAKMDEHCRLSQGIDHHQATYVDVYLAFLKKNGYVLSEHEEQFLSQPETVPVADQPSDEAPIEEPPFDEDDVDCEATPTDLF